LCFALINVKTRYRFKGSKFFSIKEDQADNLHQISSKNSIPPPATPRMSYASLRRIRGALPLPLIQSFSHSVLPSFNPCSLEVHLQPQVNPSAGEPVGYGVLLVQDGADPGIAGLVGDLHQVKDFQA
jgi:hypothetical protein